MDKQQKIARDYWDEFSKRNSVALKKNSARDVEWDSIREIFNILPEREKHIVDFACGTGYHAVRFLEEGFKVTGIDISRLSLEVLAKRADSIKKGDNLTTIRSDFTKIALPDNFDAGYLISSYHCLGSDLQKRQLMLRNMAKMIKKGGKIFIMEPNPLNPLYLFFYPFVYKNNWREGFNVVNSRIGILEKDLTRSGVKILVVAHYGFLPAFLINKIKYVKNINYFCSHLPILKLFSSFNMILGERTK